MPSPSGGDMEIQGSPGTKTNVSPDFRPTTKTLQIRRDLHDGQGGEAKVGGVADDGASARRGRARI